MGTAFAPGTTDVILYASIVTWAGAAAGAARATSATIAAPISVRSERSLPKFSSITFLYLLRVGRNPCASPETSD